MFHRTGGQIDDRLAAARRSATTTPRYRSSPCPASLRFATQRSTAHRNDAMGFNPAQGGPDATSASASQHRATRRHSTQRGSPQRFDVSKTGERIMALFRAPLRDALHLHASHHNATPCHEQAEEDRNDVPTRLPASLRFATPCITAPCIASHRNHIGGGPTRDWPPQLFAPPRDASRLRSKQRIATTAAPCRSATHHASMLRSAPHLTASHHRQENELRA